MQFRAKVFLAGKTATGFEVPSDVVAGLRGGKRPPVHVTINGYRYRSTVAPMGGVFVLGISAAHRERAGVAAGDEVVVELTLDTDERILEVPADFRDALDADLAARRVFDGLSYSRKQRFTIPIEGAKTPETRQRRIGKAVSDLRAGRLG